jgi:hypothetical protein
MQKIYTITGKTDGFGAQYQAIMSGIAICKYKNYEYLHTPIKKINNVKTINEINEINKFIGIKNKNDNKSIDIKEEFSYEVHTSSNPSIYYTKEVINIIRNYYYSTSKPDIENIDIAIHIRRGDVIKNTFGPGKIDRFTDDNFYTEIINKLLIKYPTYIINIYSEGKVEDFSIKGHDRLRFHLNRDLITTYHSLVKAKVLIMAKSSLSYSAGILNENKIYYIDFWHKKLDDWIHINNLN